jgi:hypothetical protein
MIFDCPGCKKEFEPNTLPYGDGVTCPHCGETWETDWDEDRDSVYCWILDKKMEKK